MTTFDIDSYRLPPMNVASALSMSRGLITSHSKDAAPATRKAVKKIHAKAQALQAAWAATDAGSPTRDARPADQALDNTYAAIYARLDAWRLLPEGAAPKQAAEADRLIGLLFSTGLTFLKLPYSEEWAESEKRIRRIEDEGLGESISALCHASFLAALQAAHKEYGEVLGITKTATVAESVGVAEPLKALVAAVQQYVRVVGGTVDDDDPATALAAQALLRPIDTMRSRVLPQRAPAGRAPTPPPDASGGSDTTPEPVRIPPTAPASPPATGAPPVIEAPDAPIPNPAT